MTLRKLPKELARVFLAGLIHVCRADGHVCAAEIDELQVLARTMGLEGLDEEQFFDPIEMNPKAIAAAIGLAVGGAGPYRTEPLPSEGELKNMFLDAAMRAASADSVLRPEELILLRELTEAFALPPQIGALRFGPA